MQFLIETQTPTASAIRGRQVALCPTLAEAHEIAADHIAGDELALGRLTALGSAPEGELSGGFGVVRYAPAA